MGRLCHCFFLERSSNAKPLTFMLQTGFLQHSSSRLRCCILSIAWSYQLALFKSYSLFLAAQPMPWFNGGMDIMLLVLFDSGVSWYDVLLYSCTNWSPRLFISLINCAFWALIASYMWAGGHHLHYSALPDWTQSLGMVFSLILFAPSWGGMINGVLTLSGSWDKLRTDPIIRFLIVALSFYAMSTFEGPMLSIKAVNAISHNTDWTVGHVHSGALGWVGMITIGSIYVLLPRIFNKGKKCIQPA